MEEQMELNEEALRMMQFQILKLERDNEKTHGKGDKQMMDEIQEIIEQEADLYDN